MKGFTLVEILVAITILAILGTIGFVNYQTFSATQVLNSAASDVQTLLRQAQTNATASLKCSGSGSWEWLITFTNSTDIDLKCKTSATSQETLVKSLTLPAKVKMNTIYGDPNCTWSFPATISFATLSGKVDFPGSLCTTFVIPLQFSSQDINLTKTITVTRGGAIEEGSPGPAPVSTPTPTPTPAPTSTPTPTPTQDADGDGDPDSTDCAPNDNRAFHGQTQYFTTPRSSVGGYDFDCSGTEEKDPAKNCIMPQGAGYNCRAMCPVSAGYHASLVEPPACGVAGTFMQANAWSDSICTTSSGTNTSCLVSLPCTARTGSNIGNVTMGCK